MTKDEWRAKILSREEREDLMCHEVESHTDHSLWLYGWFDGSNWEYCLARHRFISWVSILVIFRGGITI